MKEIIKLLPQDNGFKLKLVGYQLLIGLIALLLFIPAALIAASYNDVLAFIGSLLSIAAVVVFMALALKMYVNKLLIKYYPNFHISFKEAVKKGLAGFCIMLLIVIIYMIGLMIIGLIAALFDFGLFYFIAFILFLVTTVQISGLALGITYSVFENVDNQKNGFIAVFKTYFANIRNIRKSCVKITIALIVPIVVFYIGSLILIVIITFVTLFISPVVYLVTSLLLTLGFAFLIMWLIATEYVYIFKKYQDIAIEMAK